MLSVDTNGTNSIFCFILCWEKVLSGTGLRGVLHRGVLWWQGQDPGHSAVPGEMCRLLLLCFGAAVTAAECYRIQGAHKCVYRANKGGREKRKSLKVALGGF